MCEWDKLVPKNKITVKYLLFKDNECIYSGPANTFRVESLTPSTSYTFTVQNVTIENSEKSPMSDPLVAHTMETVPSEPVNFRVIGSTTNLIRVAWEPPDKLNGNLKNYFVYNGEHLVEQTSELTCIINGLTPNTGYDLHVCASNSAGKGEKSSIRGVTCDIGLHNKKYFRAFIIALSYVKTYTKKVTKILRDTKNERIFQRNKIINFESSPPKNALK